MSRSKTIPLSERYTRYLEAQERELAALTKLNSQNPMGTGRREAVKDIVSDLKLYRAINNPVDQKTIHDLLATVQSKISHLQDNYKLSGPDERMKMQGAYNEYKRQLEQIRNLLTPMKG